MKGILPNELVVLEFGCSVDCSFGPLAIEVLSCPETWAATSIPGEVWGSELIVGRLAEGGEFWVCVVSDCRADLSKTGNLTTPRAGSRRAMQLAAHMRINPRNFMS